MKKVLAAALFVLLLAPSPAYAGTVANWQMNEGKNARVMHDSTGDHNARIRSKVTPGGGVYRFIGRCCTETYDPRRIIVVPQSDELDPQDASRYEVKIRFRTNGGRDPNLVQKGQTKQPGGFFKLTLFRGKHPRCMYRDETGLTRATGMRDMDVTDGHWTKMRCISTETTTKLVVTRRGKTRVAVNDHVGALGTIDSDRPFVIGGKRDCKAIGVGCDYFKGQVDYVTVKKTP